MTAFSPARIFKQEEGKEMAGGLSGVDSQHQDMHFVAWKRTVLEEEEEAGQLDQQMQDTATIFYLTAPSGSFSAQRCPRSCKV